MGKDDLVVDLDVAVLVAVIAAAVIGFLVYRRRQLRLVDVKEIELGHVIGIGGRSVVFVGKFRGSDVAVKEYVSKNRRAEILHVEREKLMLRRNSTSTTTSKDKVISSTGHISSVNVSQSLMSIQEETSTMSSGHRRSARKVQAAEFAREVRLLERVRHANIVAFLGAFQAKDRRGVILELMHRGSLADVLANPTQVLSWKVRIGLGLDAARGLAYLHAQSPPILHHDVKSLNMLVDDRNSCSLSDFGSATSGQNINMGTVAWMSPEVLRGEPYTAACDVYSFGIVLWEIASRLEPTSGRSPKQIREDTLSGARMPLNRREWPSRLCDLIEMCWAHEPSSRPTLPAITATLADIVTDLPEEVKVVDTHSIASGSLVIGRDAMKEMQTTLLDGAMPRPFVAQRVSVLFARLAPSARLSTALEPEERASLLARLFAMYDSLGHEWGISRFQVVGDSYIGIAHEETRPSDLDYIINWTPESAICSFGLIIAESTPRVPIFDDDRPLPAGMDALEVRIGIATGPVGFQLVSFDRMEILGDTVNVASRLEAHSRPSCANVSGPLFSIVQGEFKSTKHVKSRINANEVQNSFILKDGPRELVGRVKHGRVAPMPADAQIPRSYLDNGSAYRAKSDSDSALVSPDTSSVLSLASGNMSGMHLPGALPPVRKHRGGGSSSAQSSPFSVRR